MYTITNDSLSLRVVPTALGSVAIPPRSKRDGLQLAPGVAKLLRRGQMRGDRIAIEGENDDARSVLENANDVRRGYNIYGNNGRINIPPSVPVDRDEIQESKRKEMQELIDNWETIKFAEFRARAMLLLGDRWPTGVGITGRRQVVELLRRALAGED